MEVNISAASFCSNNRAGLASPCTSSPDAGWNLSALRKGGSQQPFESFTPAGKSDPYPPQGSGVPRAHVDSSTDLPALDEHPAFLCWLNEVVFSQPLAQTGSSSCKKASKISATRIPAEALRHQKTHLFRSSSSRQESCLATSSDFSSDHMLVKILLISATAEAA